MTEGLGGQNDVMFGNYDRAPLGRNTGLGQPSRSFDRGTSTQPPLILYFIAS